jgi:hypothetical protein
VQEAAVVALSTIADTAQDRFQEYYGSFVPHLKSILSVGGLGGAHAAAAERRADGRRCALQHAQGKEYSLLRAKTFECVTLMGLAVGKEMFHRDALEIVEALKGLGDMGICSEDPNITYMLTRCVRLASQRDTRGAGLAGRLPTATVPGTAGHASARC